MKNKRVFQVLTVVFMLVFLFIIIFFFYTEKKNQQKSEQYISQEIVPLENKLNDLTEQLEEEQRKALTVSRSSELLLCFPIDKAEQINVISYWIKERKESISILLNSEIDEDVAREIFSAIQVASITDRVDVAFSGNISSDVNHRVEKLSEIAEEYNVSTVNVWITFNEGLSQKEKDWIKNAGFFACVMSEIKNETIDCGVYNNDLAYMEFFYVYNNQDIERVIEGLRDQKGTAVVYLQAIPDDIFDTETKRTEKILNYIDSVKNEYGFTVDNFTGIQDRVSYSVDEYHELKIKFEPRRKELQDQIDKLEKLIQEKYASIKIT